MLRWLACARGRSPLGAAAVLLAAAAPAPAAGAGLLERYAPVVVHDSRERSPLTSVHAFAGRVPGVPGTPPRPAVYGRRSGPWLQYWLLFADNPQDRGVLGTGRHEGDWELVQYRLRGDRLVEAVYAQHSGAESCGAASVRRSRGRPVAFVARGSHAAYFRPGLRDRTWPDPNDEADGQGPRVRPRLIRISEGRPPWMAYPGRWGATRAGWIPGEMDSPRGPAFQGVRWSDPTAWAATARPCTRRGCDERGECDGRETVIAALLVVLGLFATGLYARRRLGPAEAAAP